MKRYGPKNYLGPNVAALGASAYLGVDAGYRVLTGWRGAVGALVRWWQDYNGAGDRLIDQVSVFPVGPGGTANYLATGALAATVSAGASAAVKAASIATPTVSVVNGSAIVTRDSGSFVADGAKKGMGLTAASSLALGSSILQVDAARLVLDRPATGTNASLAARVTNVPDVVRLAVLSFATGGLETSWPTDGINFGFHAAAGGTVDSTGLMIEAWPIFDGAELLGSPASLDVAGLG